MQAGSPQKQDSQFSATRQNSQPLEGLIGTKIEIQPDSASKEEIREDTSSPNRLLPHNQQKILEQTAKIQETVNTRSEETEDDSGLERQEKSLITRDHDAHSSKDFLRLPDIQPEKRYPLIG